jgi:hypothetical protein
MKTSELQGAALDWAVAKCEGRKPSCYTGIVRATAHPDFPDSPPIFGPELNYSADWAIGGSIIERERIATWFEHYEDEDAGLPCWFAAKYCEREYPGPTPLIAAMRCYVASRVGDEIELPEEIKGVTA